MKVQTFPQDDLGPALAARVADNLRAAIEAKGTARLAVPGGTTPAPFLKALAEAELSWKDVVVTLTDERCVPTSHPRSNQRLLMETFMTGATQAARFVPLVGADSDPGSDIAGTAEAVREIVLPLDVCVLGMGADMHTASLFPNATGLGAALDMSRDDVVAIITAPGAEEPRVTLTASALGTAAHTYLLITGHEKRAALDQAMVTANPLKAPIWAILNAAKTPTVFYAD